MSHTVKASRSEHDTPTLWPLQSSDWTLMEFAVATCREENRALKNLVASLSEIILKTFFDKK